MSTALAAGSGLCWTLAYLLIIRTGRRERTYGVPIVAFAANISWAFLYSFVRPPHGVQHAVDVVWFLLDCGVGYTVLRFGPEEFPYLPRRVFYGCLAAVIVLAYPAVDLIGAQFDAGDGAYSAFGLNLMTSALFLAMFAARPAGRGQSAGIALAKLAGAALASGSLALRNDPAARYHGGLLTYLYVSVFILDLVYLGLMLSIRTMPVPVSSVATVPETRARLDGPADLDSRG